MTSERARELLAAFTDALEPKLRGFGSGDMPRAIAAELAQTAIDALTTLPAQTYTEGVEAAAKAAEACPAPVFDYYGSVARHRDSIVRAIRTLGSDRDRSGEADETAEQAQPEARARAEGIAQGDLG